MDSTVVLVNGQWCPVDIGTVLEAIRDSYLKNSSNNDGEKVYGGTCKIAPFKQSSILERLINYCES